jgi:hypothetical protein
VLSEYMYRADLEPDASPLYSILGLLAARRHVKTDRSALLSTTRRRQSGSPASSVFH